MSNYSEAKKELLNYIYARTPLVIIHSDERERVERMLGSKVVFASSIEGAILVPYDSDDLELTIGQDFALGYESHDTKELTLFATESFTFRILEPKAIVCFK